MMLSFCGCSGGACSLLDACVGGWYLLGEGCSHMMLSFCGCSGGACSLLDACVGGWYLLGEGCSHMMLSFCGCSGGACSLLDACVGGWYSLGEGCSLFGRHVHVARFLVVLALGRISCTYEVCVCVCVCENGTSQNAYRMEQWGHGAVEA